MESISLNTGTLVIRVDASSRIGTGHIMRCFALAQAWQLEGGKVVFLSHCESDALRQRIADAGMEFIPIAYPHPDPRDLQATLGILRIRSVAAIENSMWLVLDGYHFDPVYQQVVRTAGYRLLVVDDMAHLPAYHADILLNQNLGAEKLKYHCDPDTTLLLGSRYALLRQEFLSWRGWQREIPDVARKVLITLGGSDPENVTPKVIQALQQVRVNGLEAVVVVGGSNPHYRELETAAKNSRVPTRLERNATNMPELMAWADIAISAAGSTCWELLYMTVPTIILALAKNQLQVEEKLSENGSAISLGWHEEVSPEDIKQEVEKTLLSPEKRKMMVEAGKGLVDGKGVFRVIRTVLDNDVKLRRARPDDRKMIWEWANEADLRAVSFSSEPIPWEDHTRWFDDKLNDPCCLCYIGMNEAAEAVGQVRCDINGEVGTISVGLDKRFRGKGYGSKLIRQGSRKVFANSTIMTMHAYVKENNQASLHAFAKAGYHSPVKTEVKGTAALRFVLSRGDL